MSFLEDVKEKEEKEPKPKPVAEPPRDLKTEQSMKLKFERELLFIEDLIDEEPKAAYRQATQLRNQLKDYLSKVEAILNELGEDLDAEGATLKSANEE